MLCGMRQGSPEAGIIFAAWIAMKLQQLSQSWQKRGIGLLLGRVGEHYEPLWSWKLKYFQHVLEVDVDHIHIAALGFSDDVIFAASSTGDAEIMLREFARELREAN